MIRWYKCEQSVLTCFTTSRLWSHWKEHQRLFALFCITSSANQTDGQYEVTTTDVISGAENWTRVRHAGDVIRESADRGLFEACAPQQQPHTEEEK